MDMMGRIINGQISVYSRDAADGFISSTSSTSIMQTALINTVELQPIFEILEVCVMGASACNGESTNQNLNIYHANNRYPVATRARAALPEYDVEYFLATALSSRTKPTHHALT
jgi:hypothetical protein